MTGAGRAGGKISRLDWTVCLAVLLPSLSSDHKVVASEEGLIEKFCSGIIMILSVLTGDLTVQERLVRSL